ncbi:MAG: hypothetical protein N3B10_07065 [Armatimonadetes bacterium]|nr:hypothetical protein [Armatimonadota bacterium]
MTNLQAPNFSAKISVAGADEIRQQISVRFHLPLFFFGDYGLKPAAWLEKTVTNNICKIAVSFC